MTADRAARALGQSYLDGLLPETRLARRAHVLSAVYSALCRSVRPNVHRQLEMLFVAELAGHVATALGHDESTTRAALLDHISLAGVDEFARLHGGENERVWEAAHRVGETLDLLLAVEKGGERKGLGSYFTPRHVAHTLVERSWPHVLALPRVERGQLPLVLDPACGGGAFLVEAVRRIARHLQTRDDPASASNPELTLTRAAGCAYGIDVSPFAVATTRAALRLIAPGLDTGQPSRERLFVADALLDARSDEDASALHGLREKGGQPLQAQEAFAQVGQDPWGFDWIVGNPPWVAFQGRATQPISVELRAFYRRRYQAFSGYPTTQGMFAQRATELAPRGVIGLLVPSSLADLDGYKSARAAVALRHKVSEPLLEFGQDAFQSVVQPCFGLVAAPRGPDDAVPEAQRGRRWVLEERSRLTAEVDRVSPPACIAVFDQLPCLPKNTFGELGFQSNTRVVQELFRRAAEPTGVYTLGLLEGRCVQEFKQRPPRVFLAPNQDRLAQLKARLRDAVSYQKVDFVVRQTAAFTIAARHNGQPFRNSLIAGYAQPDLDTDLLVGLLNSALFRCLHLSRQRDARQATFPQVKVAHLRALPAPPQDQVARNRVRLVSASAAEAGGLSPETRRQLDGAVFQLYGLSEGDGRAIVEYLSARAPRALMNSTSTAFSDGSAGANEE